MRKILSMLLALSMMLTVLAACNNEPVVDETPDDGQQQEENQGNDKVEEPFDGTLKLVVDGVSDYVIVRGENAYISEVTASTELQKYLKQISGVEIPIVTDATAPVEKEIVVCKTNRESDGEFDRTELGTDGFVIKTENGKLWLVGGEKRGTLYSVYTFLEEYLGCRFYTDTFEKIPEMKTVSLEKIEENKQIPVIETRNSFWYDMYNHSLSAKLKLNCRRGRGDLPDTLGGSDSFAGGECHTLYALAEMTGDHMWNEPCLTSEDIYNTVLKNVRALLAANPTAKYVSVSQNDSDNERRGCECDNCMAVYNKYGNWTGLYLEFVNRIAREIKDEYPDVMIHTFAYRFTRLVPEGLEIEDNVMIQLCSIEANRRAPIADYDKYTDPEDYEKIDDFEVLLKEWSAVCDYLSVWDYVTDYGNYSISLPGFEAVKENVRLFADNNVKNLFLQGAYQSENGEFGELKGYIMAKLLWNPYMSDEEYWAMIDEFLVDYYGPGGVKLREYIDLLQAETASGVVSLNGAKPVYGPAFGLSNYFEDKVYSVTFRREGYPEAITEDVIRNYKDFDWLPYINYYKGYVDEDSILGKLVAEGRRLFNEAMEMAENDRQREAIDKSTIQIDLMEAYYTNLKLRKGKYWAKDIVRNYSWANPGVFTADEEKQYMKDVQDYVIQVVEDMYAEYNKQLSEKLDKYGAYNLNEGYRKAHGEVIQFVTLGSDGYFN